MSDDQGIVSNTEKGLQRIVDRLDEASKMYEMKINVKKTKVMLVSKEAGKKMKIVIDGKEVEQVDRFKYLGSMLTEDGKSMTDIKVRVAMAKEAFGKRSELLVRKMSKKVKKRIVKCLVWSIALYGCETWALGKVERDRLEAFEMWC
jgi:HJR/Mrr/RecB family endonuclease